MLRFDDEMLRTFFDPRGLRADFDALSKLMTSDNCLAIEVTGENAIQTVAVIAGPENPSTAKQQAPKSWRAVYGSQGVLNGVHISETQSAYQRESDFIFSEATRIQGFTALLNNCSLCLIKPHAIAFAGQIIDRILDEGFEISAA